MSYKINIQNLSGQVLSKLWKYWWSKRNMLDMFQNTLGVVIDAGSHNVKAGFAAESTPRKTFSSTVGRYYK